MTVHSIRRTSTLCSRLRREPGAFVLSLLRRPVMVTALCALGTLEGCLVDGDGGDNAEPYAVSNQDAEGTGMGGSSGAPSMTGAPLIVINEFVASNVTGIMDEAGGTGDWIELYNLSDEDVDLTGYFVSDDTQSPTKGLLRDLTIGAGSTLLLWADGDPEEGPNHLPFNLDKDGEEVVLTSPMGDVLDSVDFESAPSDTSFARIPDGTGDFFICTTPTPEAPNDPTCQP